MYQSKESNTENEMKISRIAGDFNTPFTTMYRTEDQQHKGI